jgi:hypothetical protein
MQVEVKILQDSLVFEEVILSTNSIGYRRDIKGKQY